MVDNENDEKNYSQMAQNMNINNKSNRGINQQEEWASAIEGLKKTNERVKSALSPQIGLTTNNPGKNGAKSVSDLGKNLP